MFFCVYQHSYAASYSKHTSYKVENSRLPLRFVRAALGSNFNDYQSEEKRAKSRVQPNVKNLLVHEQGNWDHWSVKYSSCLISYSVSPVKDQHYKHTHEEKK